MQKTTGLKFMLLPLLVIGLANCKKKSNSSNTTNAAGTNMKTEHLKLLHRHEARADGTIKTVDIKEISATSDGRLHVLYIESNSFGAPLYFRRTFSAAGDSLATPSIHTDVLTIAANNAVTDNWSFRPYSDKLTLSYHPTSSYIYKLYVVDDMSQTYQFTDASFGGLPRMCYNGDKLAAYGYEQYFTNSTYVQSQHYFTWNHNGVNYSGAYTHTIPGNTASEDLQRRAFAADPLDDNNLGLCYIDGSYIYMQQYNRNTGLIQTIDSMATAILKPLTRVVVSDASMTARTTRDGQKVIFFVKYLSGANPGDGMNKYATFIYSKATQKLSKVVTDFVVPITVNMNFDNDGNLIYARPDVATEPGAWGIFKVGTDGVAARIAHVSGTKPSNVEVSKVADLNGKIHLSVCFPSMGSATQGPLNYLMIVE